MPMTSHTLTRLRTMRVRDLADRGRQEVLKRVDRLPPRAGQPLPCALLARQAPALTNPESALEALRTTLPRNFFAGLSEPGTGRAIETRAGDERREVVAAATRLIEGRFNLLGYRGLSFGDPIDWHLDPVSSRRAPLVHWSRLDPLDPAVVGDSKIVWEFNRHQWIVHLAQASVLTRDERYAAECVSMIESWIRSNPIGVGINWASSLEVAYRLMSWCWVATLVRDAPAVTGSWAQTLLAAVWAHAHHVSRYLSRSFSPNTHLTGEALGLFYAGVLFPDFRDAPQWRELGMRVLLDQSAAQLSPDGVHFELSTCYHRYTVETYLQFALLATRNGLPVPEDIWTRLESMMEFLIAIRQPDGSLPPIGDDDGGALCPLFQRSRDRAGGIYAVAASLFRRSDFAWAGSGDVSHLIWMRGTAGLDAFDSVRSAPPSVGASRLFPSGGYAAMRSGWDVNAHQMIVDVGPLGCPISSGHGHADLLSVQCVAFGEPILIDAGTGSYAAGEPWRDYFRSTTAHSTLRVDEREHASPAAPFRWHSRPCATLLEWRSDDLFDVAHAEHDAYSDISVRCRRRAIFVKPHYWLLIDDVDGHAPHRVDVTFQFAPMRVTRRTHPWVCADTPGGRSFWVAAFASDPLQADVACGELAPIRGWTSAGYGQREPAPVLTYSSLASLPWRCLSLLFPEPVPSASPPFVSPLYDDRHRPRGLVFHHSGLSLVIDDHVGAAASSST
jgi:hypothetical protein